MMKDPDHHPENCPECARKDEQITRLVKQLDKSNQHLRLQQQLWKDMYEQLGGSKQPPRSYKHSQPGAYRNSYNETLV